MCRLRPFKQTSPFFYSPPNTNSSIKATTHYNDQSFLLLGLFLTVDDSTSNQNQDVAVTHSELTSQSHQTDVLHRQVKILQHKDYPSDSIWYVKYSFQTNMHVQTIVCFVLFPAPPLNVLMCSLLPSAQPQSQISAAAGRGTYL